MSSYFSPDRYAPQGNYEAPSPTAGRASYPDRSIATPGSRLWAAVSFGRGADEPFSPPRLGSPPVWKSPQSPGADSTFKRNEKGELSKQAERLQGRIDGLVKEIAELRSLSSNREAIGSGTAQAMLAQASSKANIAEDLRWCMASLVQAQLEVRSKTEQERATTRTVTRESADLRAALKTAEAAPARLRMELDLARAELGASRMEEKNAVVVAAEIRSEVSRLQSALARSIVDVEAERQTAEIFRDEVTNLKAAQNEEAWCFEQQQQKTRETDGKIDQDLAEMRATVRHMTLEVQSGMAESSQMFDYSKFVERECLQEMRAMQDKSRLEAVVAGESQKEAAQLRTRLRTLEGELEDARAKPQMPVKQVDNQAMFEMQTRMEELENELVQARSRSVPEKPDMTLGGHVEDPSLAETVKKSAMVTQSCEVYRLQERVQLLETLFNSPAITQLTCQENMVTTQLKSEIEQNSKPQFPCDNMHYARHSSRDATALGGLPDLRTPTSPQSPAATLPQKQVPPPRLVETPPSPQRLVDAPPPPPKRTLGMSMLDCEGSPLSVGSQVEYHDDETWKGTIVATDPNSGFQVAWASGDFAGKTRPSIGKFLRVLRAKVVDSTNCHLVQHQAKITHEPSAPMGVFANVPKTQSSQNQSLSCARGGLRTGTLAAVGDLVKVLDTENTRKDFAPAGIGGIRRIVEVAAGKTRPFLLSGSDLWFGTGDIEPVSAPSVLAAAVDNVRGLEGQKVVNDESVKCPTAVVLPTNSLQEAKPSVENHGSTSSHVVGKTIPLSKTSSVAKAKPEKQKPPALGDLVKVAETEVTRKEFPSGIGSVRKVAEVSVGEARPIRLDGSDVKFGMGDVESFSAPSALARAVERAGAAENDKLAECTQCPTAVVLSAASVQPKGKQAKGNATSSAAQTRIEKQKSPAVGDLVKVTDTEVTRKEFPQGVGSVRKVVEVSIGAVRPILLDGSDNRFGFGDVETFSASTALAEAVERAGSAVDSERVRPAVVVSPDTKQVAAAKTVPFPKTPSVAKATLQKQKPPVVGDLVKVAETEVTRKEFPSGIGSVRKVVKVSIGETRPVSLDGSDIKFGLGDIESFSAPTVLAQAVERAGTSESAVVERADYQGNEKHVGDDCVQCPVAVVLPATTRPESIKQVEDEAIPLSKASSAAQTGPKKQKPPVVGELVKVAETEVTRTEFPSGIGSVRKVVEVSVGETRPIRLDGSEIKFGMNDIESFSAPSALAQAVERAGAVVDGERVRPVVAVPPETKQNTAASPCVSGAAAKTIPVSNNPDVAKATQEKQKPPVVGDLVKVAETEVTRKEFPSGIGSVRKVVKISIGQARPVLLDGSDFKFGLEDIELFSAPSALAKAIERAGTAENVKPTVEESVQCPALAANVQPEGKKQVKGNATCFATKVGVDQQKSPVVGDLVKVANTEVTRKEFPQGVGSVRKVAKISVGEARPILLDGSDIKFGFGDVETFSAPTALAEAVERAASAENDNAKSAQHDSKQNAQASAVSPPGISNGVAAKPIPLCKVPSVATAGLEQRKPPAIGELVKVADTERTRQDWPSGIGSVRKVIGVSVGEPRPVRLDGCERSFGICDVEPFSASSALASAVNNIQSAPCPEENPKKHRNAAANVPDAASAKSKKTPAVGDLVKVLDTEESRKVFPSGVGGIRKVVEVLVDVARPLRFDGVDGCLGLDDIEPLSAPSVLETAVNNVRQAGAASAATSAKGVSKAPSVAKTPSVAKVEEATEVYGVTSAKKVCKTSEPCEATPPERKAPSEGDLVKILDSDVSRMAFPTGIGGVRKAVEVSTGDVRPLRLDGSSCKLGFEDVEPLAAPSALATAVSNVREAVELQKDSGPAQTVKTQQASTVICTTPAEPTPPEKMKPCVGDLVKVLDTEVSRNVFPAGIGGARKIIEISPGAVKPLRIDGCDCKLGFEDVEPFAAPVALATAVSNDRDASELQKDCGQNQTAKVQLEPTAKQNEAVRSERELPSVGDLVKVLNTDASRKAFAAGTGSVRKVLEVSAGEAQPLRLDGSDCKVGVEDVEPVSAQMLLASAVDNVRPSSAAEDSPVHLSSPIKA